MRIDPVTKNPDILAELLRLWDNDEDVEARAQELGLHPHGRRGGQTHEISLYHPPTAANRMLIWDSDVPEMDDDEALDDILSEAK